MCMKESERGRKHAIARETETEKESVCERDRAREGAPSGTVDRPSPPAPTPGGLQAPPDRPPAEDYSQKCDAVPRRARI